VWSTEDYVFLEGKIPRTPYVVLFKLHRLSARDLSMVIETAFLVDEDDFRVKLLQGRDTKPFLVAVRNVFAKRPPFQGPALRKSKKNYKKKKQTQKQLSSPNTK
jgi:23S rRNA U2552 (ribose-2'-O)-methylase RlmE/FtsJ